MINSFSLPNGLYIEGNPYIHDLPNPLIANGTNNRSRTITFQNNVLLIWSPTVITNTSTNDFKAMECSLSYCVKNCTSRVLNGTLFEESFPLPLDITPGSYLLDDPLYPTDPVISSGPIFSGVLDIKLAVRRTDLQLGEEYTISQTTINGIGVALANVFSDPSAPSHNVTGTNATGYCMMGDYFSDYMQPLHQSSDLNETFTGLAMSMSNAIRAGADNGTLVYGTTNIIVYKVRWQWLALPFISVFGGCIFLASTILCTHQRSLSLWKSSAFPVLKVDAEIGPTFGDEALLVSQSDKRAREEDVR